MATSSEAKDVEMTKRQLDLALAAINKEYGAGTVFNLEDSYSVSWPAISTGALTLDKALGIGGLPLGRIVEIFGPESSGKTTLALSVLAQAQKDDSFCAFIDTEHALDPSYASKIGVKLDKVLISQPDYGEQAIDIAEKLIGTGNIKVLVIDSVAALIPKAELEGTMESQHMGLQARLMSKAMRKLTPKASEHKTLVIFVNQLREKIGIMFGSPEITPGGRALRFSASVRIDIRKTSTIEAKDGSGQTGVRAKAKVVKNKMAPPFRVAEFDILYGMGINEYGCIIDEAINMGILRQKGAWISFGKDVLENKEGDTFAQGRDKAVIALSQDLDLADELKREILGDNV